MHPVPLFQTSLQPAYNCASSESIMGVNPRAPPARLRVKVDGVYRDEKETQSARCGENLRLRLSGCEETDISPGFVLSSVKSPVPVVTQFEAQLVRACVRACVRATACTGGRKKGQGRG